MELNLGPRQKRTIAIGLTGLAAAAIVWVLGVTIQHIASFIETFSSVFLPLAVAGVLALVLKPFYRVLAYKGRLKPIGAVLVVYLSIFLPITVFFVFFGAILYTEISEIVEKLPTLVESIRVNVLENLPAVKAFWAEHELSNKSMGMLEEKGGLLAKGLLDTFVGAIGIGTSAFGKLAGALSWIVLPIYLAFFLMAKPFPIQKIEDFLPFFEKETRIDVVYLIRQFIEIVVTFFRGQLVIAVCQGLLFAFGFLLVGLPYGFLIGIALGFLNLIPYLGSMVGLGVALPLAFFHPEGGMLTLGLTIAVFTVVQCIEGYILTPKVMGERTGLHPMAIMVALFFWGTAFEGIFGMVLAIPLTAFLVVFWRLAKKKYIKPLV